MFFELSLEADRDLEEIFDHTFERYGIDQAVNYVISFDLVFEKLLDDPLLGRQRSEIRPSLRSVVKVINHFDLRRIRFVVL